MGLSTARPSIQFCAAASSTEGFPQCSARGEAVPSFWASPTWVLTKRLAGAVALRILRLRWMIARLMVARAVQLLLMGAAASGRRTRWTGAQPRSYTYAPMLPSRAAFGAAGSGALWPRPRVGRPSPWGLSGRQWMTMAAAASLATSSGHCRCYHTADASPLEAVGRAGFGRLGFRVSVANLAALALRSCGTRTRAEAPLSPFSGGCGLYRTTDASGLEAVGRFGVGLLGAWRGLVVTAFVAAVFVVASLSVPGELQRLVWARARATYVLLAIPGSCSLYRAAEAPFARAVGGVGGGMLGLRRAGVVAVAARWRADPGPLASYLRFAAQAGAQRMSGEEEGADSWLLAAVGRGWCGASTPIFRLTVTVRTRASGGAAAAISTQYGFQLPLLSSSFTLPPRWRPVRSGRRWLTEVQAGIPTSGGAGAAAVSTVTAKAASEGAAFRATAVGGLWRHLLLQGEGTAADTEEDDYARYGSGPRPLGTSIGILGPARRRPALVRGG